jgi:hypothetical protein
MRDNHGEHSEHGEKPHSLALSSLLAVPAVFAVVKQSLPE